MVRVVRVSGTIRKSEEELIRRTKGEMVRAREAEDKGEGDLLGRLIGGVGQSVPAAGIEEVTEDGAVESDEDSEAE